MNSAPTLNTIDTIKTVTEIIGLIAVSPIAAFIIIYNWERITDAFNRLIAHPIYLLYLRATRQKEWHFAAHDWRYIEAYLQRKATAWLDDDRHLLDEDINTTIDILISATPKGD